MFGALAAGRVAYRPGATMASSDDLHIRIDDKQTHAGRPWNCIDPIVVSAQVILGLQTVISRQSAHHREPGNDPRRHALQHHS
jgi:metal-dependent amidase/aminoacylase/carboxypeptidase family protein